MAFNHSTAYMKTEPLSSEKQKESDKYMEEEANYHIAALVRDNSYMETAMNYYSSKMSAEDFQYLEDIYGLQNPIDIRFTNIIKPRIDALVGLSLLSVPEFTTAFVDKDTIASAQDEKNRAFIEDLKKKTSQFIGAGVEKTAKDPKGKGAPKEETVDTFLDELDKKYGEDYESSYTIAANDVIDILINDPGIDFPNVKTKLSKDYFIHGQAYAKVTHVGEGRKPIIERIPPNRVFSNRPRVENDFKKADAVVVVEYMRPHQIIKKFGELLRHEDAVELFGRAFSSVGASGDLDHGPVSLNDDMEPGRQMDTLHMDTGYSNNSVSQEGSLYPVYHVEWLASTKIKKGSGYVYREDRYEIYRLGSDMFLGGRRCDEAPRRRDTPWKTELSYKALVNHAGNGDIISTVLQLKELQDLYNIIMFFRDNTIATSGVSGSRVNIAAIPKALGKNLMERLTKWITIKKQGLELVDPTEEGAELFQHYGDFDASINGNSLNAISAVLESLMVQADIISGVPRQMLGIIEERDAVENVKVGMNQVAILSLEMFRDIDRTLAHSLQALLDVFKYSFRDKVFEGVKRVGLASIPFAIQSDKFSSADHEVNVVSAGLESARLMKIQNLAKELLSGGMLDPDAVVSVMNTRSVVKAEYIIKKAVAAKKAEMNSMQQMQSQLEQAEAEMKKLTAEIARLENNAKASSIEKLKIQEKRDAKLAENENRRLDIEEESIKNTKEYKKQELALKRASVELEKEQLLFGSGKSKEINNSVV